MDEQVKAITDTLEDTETTLILTDQSSFRTVANSVVEYYTTNDYSGIIFTTDRSFEDIEDELTYHNIEIDDLSFLDLVSKTRGITTSRDDVELITSPTAFNDVSIGLRELINQMNDESKDRFILLDSLTAYLLYGNLKDIGNFIKRTTDRARDEDYTYIMTAVKTQLDEEVVKKLMTFCDTKIDLTTD